MSKQHVNIEQTKILISSDQIYTISFWNGFPWRNQHYFGLKSTKLSICEIDTA